MTIEERQTTVQTNQPVVPPDLAGTPMAADPRFPASSRESFTSRSTIIRASGAEQARRLVVLIFGLIQAVIVLRIVLLILDARAGNGIVSGVMNISQVFVGPFDGILHTNALTAGGATLDVSAVVALVGWTILEFGIFAAINLFRRESTVGNTTIG